ncbi:MAG: hypothetical protein FWC66_09200 [Oscillospiraceae bacterium]|nr:hypothetical protein [Oscillospiraceae bacterium]
MMKDAHKWSADISAIEFTFSDNGSCGKVYWQKRKELIIKAGAVLTPDPQRNKDGSLNFSAKVANALRDEHAAFIKDGVTTEDIVFPSPNEVGLFLRYGGENTWLSLKDEAGKTLHDYSVVLKDTEI